MAQVNGKVYHKYYLLKDLPGKTGILKAGRVITNITMRQTEFSIQGIFEADDGTQFDLNTVMQSVGIYFAPLDEKHERFVRVVDDTRKLINDTMYDDKRRAFLHKLATFLFDSLGKQFGKGE